VLVVEVVDGLEEAVFVLLEVTFVIVPVDVPVEATVPVPVLVPVVEAREPEVEVVVVPLAGPPCSWPFPARYAGAALYSEGSVKWPMPYATPLGSVNGSVVDEPSVPLIVQRPVHMRLVGSMESENW